ncbi:MAG: PepSY-associated TM helix domain-containing protein [Pseudomonadota bacterium]
MSRQRFFNLARSVHLYSSTSLFATLIFFCVTGFTLSHDWYLDESASDTSVRIPVPANIANALRPDNWSPDLDLLQEVVANKAGLHSPRNIELDQEYGEIIMRFESPDGNAEALFSAQGIMVDMHRESWLTVLNNLHKNRNAGVIWSWFVDISAIGMVLFALTGLIIVFQNRRKRSQSLWVIGLGIATPFLFYFSFVPMLPGTP